MRVGLLALNNEFLDYKSTGSRFYGYIHYIYTAMMKSPQGIHIEKIDPRLDPTIGRGFTLMSKTATMDLSRFDIIHALDLAPFFPQNKGKARTLTTFNDLQFVLKPELNEDVRRTVKGTVWIEVVMKLAMKSALASDYAIAASGLTRDDLVKLGYNKRKIFVVGHAVSKEILTTKKISKKGRKFVVGYLGALRTRKNPEFALRAFHKIHDKGMEFDVWGKLGWERELLLKRYGADHRIRFRGFAPEDKLVSIYDSFDVLTYPSLYEGFGIPLLEAQARGIPVIIYKKGKIPKETAKYCIKADDESHMAQIISDLKANGYNEKQRKKAMRYAAGFTWERAASEVLKVYKKILY